VAEPPWRLEHFLERFDAWCLSEDVSDDERLLVIAWVMSRSDDPYRGVRREPGFPDLWFGPIPSTQGHAQVIACSYWIEASTRSVRCNGFARLSLPI